MRQQIKNERRAATVGSALNGKGRKLGDAGKEASHEVYVDGVAGHDLLFFRLASFCKTQKYNAFL